MEEIQKTEIHYVEKNSSIYPARLRELSGMPKQLYYIGRFPEDNKPTAAVPMEGYRHFGTGNF